jgi:hypothetical protein
MAPFLATFLLPFKFVAKSLHTQPVPRACSTCLLRWHWGPKRTIVGPKVDQASGERCDDCWAVSAGMAQVESYAPPNARRANLEAAKSPA